MNSAEHPINKFKRLSYLKTCILFSVIVSGCTTGGGIGNPFQTPVANHAIERDASISTA